MRRAICRREGACHLGIYQEDYGRWSVERAPLRRRDPDRRDVYDTAAEALARVLELRERAYWVPDWAVSLLREAAEGEAEEARDAR
jgi:hypothetical protein